MVSPSSAPTEPGAPSVRRSVRCVAALLTGFGGLLFETAILRRFGLLLGNTALAAALTMGCFLCGLGVGSWWATRRPCATPGPTAGRRYQQTGALILCVLLAVRSLPAAVDPILGAGLCVVLVGGPALWMGVAFPRLFAGLERLGEHAALCSTNLLGSVLGAWVAANRLVPLAGMQLTLFLAALAYGAAGVLLRLRTAAEPEVSARSRSTPAVDRDDLACAAGAGFALVGFEILLLRRLPFWLEGFQPTLAGVFAAALLTSALGAAATVLLPPMRRGGHAARTALVLTAFGAALGLHEHLVPLLLGLSDGATRSGGGWTVEGDLGFHLRILALATIAAAPVGLPAGAVLPLLLARRSGVVRDRVAGGLFFAQGLGALVAALVVGQVLPALAPQGYFTLVPIAVAVGAIAAARLRAVHAVTAGAVVAVMPIVGVPGPGTPFDPVPPVRGSRFDRPSVYRPIAFATDAGTTASVAYDRSQHGMVLFTDEFRAAWVGPDTDYMKVLGHLPFLLRDDLRDVAIIALGTGTTAEAVCTWTTPQSVQVVEISPAVLSLADHFAADGPVSGARRAAFASDPRAQVHVDDGRRFVQQAAPQSFDLLTMEPLLPYAPGTAALYSAEFYAAVARSLRDDGLCVQWVPTHAMPLAMFRTLLATFAGGFPYCSVWLIEQSTLLVGSKRPHLPALEDLQRRLASAPALARRTLHEAGLCAPRDFAAALVGALDEHSFADAEILHDDRPFLESIGYWGGFERLGFLSANLAALEPLAASGAGGDAPEHLASPHWVDLRGERLRALVLRNDAVLATAAVAAQSAAAASALFARAPASVLLHQEALRARRLALEAQVRETGARNTADAARRFIHLDPGSAILQAAAGADITDPEQRAAQVARAVAVDPTLPVVFPAAFGDSAILPPDPRSPLEDLAVLVEGDDLVRAASGSDPRAVALRGAFGVRVALALVARAARQPLEGEQRESLGEVADPAVLEAYAEAVVARGGDLLAELVGVWRGDLDMPSALREVARGEVSVRVRCAESIAGRRGPAVADLLALLLCDDDIAVRRAAAGALVRSFGERVSYDPEAPSADRQRAADELRSLHNRRP